MLDKYVIDIKYIVQYIGYAYKNIIQIIDRNDIS